jgi:hypothetical protein
LSIIAPRDFLTLRNYYTSPEKEEMILIRSVLHNGNSIFSHLTLFLDFPEKKDIVRAHVHLTAYYISPKEGGGCVFNYMTQTDMKGFIPTFFLIDLTKIRWAVNSAASILGQKAVDELRAMSKIYPEYLAGLKKEKEAKLENEKIKEKENQTQTETEQQKTII